MQQSSPVGIAECPDKAFNTEVLNTINTLPSGIYFRSQNRRNYTDRKTMLMCQTLTSVGMLCQSQNPHLMGEVMQYEMFEQMDPKALLKATHH